MQQSYLKRRLSYGVRSVTEELRLLWEIMIISHLHYKKQALVKMPRYLYMALSLALSLLHLELNGACIPTVTKLTHELNAIPFPVPHLKQFQITDEHFEMEPVH